MISGILAATCATWGIVVTDVVAESARSGGRNISIFGHRIATGLGPALASWTIAALSCSAVVAIAFAWHFWRVGRLERQIDTEIERRWNELSLRAAGMEARNNLLEWRVPILQSNVNELLGKRDELLGDLSHINERKRVLKEIIADMERSLDPQAPSVVRLPESPAVSTPQASEPEPESEEPVVEVPGTPTRPAISARGDEGKVSGTEPG